MKIRLQALSAACALVAAGLGSSAMAASVDLHGYFRSSAGSSADGGQQICFRLPGSAVWFRLGNECDLYAGLTLDSELGKTDGTAFKSHFTFAQGTQQTTNWEQSGVAFREAYVEAQDFGAGMGVPALKGSTLWVGKRFTPNSDDFHMLDYNYWDGFWGGGAGISNINLGFAKFDYSYLRTAQQNWDGTALDVTNLAGTKIGTTSPTTGLGSFRPDLVSGGAATVTTHAFRLNGIGLNPGGSINLGLDLVSANNRGTVAGGADVAGKSGVLATVAHVQDNLLGLGGFNKVVLQVATGAAGLKMAPNVAYTAEGHRAWSLFDMWVMEPKGTPFTMSAVAGVRSEKVDGTGGDNGSTEWFIGARPQFHLNNIWSLMSEVGYQEIKPKAGGVTGDAGKLFKATFGTQFSMGSSIWSRPSLRFFATYAKWNDVAAASGVVCTGRDCGTAVPFFGNKRNALSYGAQVEAWF